MREGDLFPQLDRLGANCSVFIERLWRTVKYEEIYRNEYDSLLHLRTCLTDYFAFYNHRGSHSALGELIPRRSNIQ